MPFVPHPRAFQIVAEGSFAPADLMVRQQFSTDEKIWTPGSFASAIDIVRANLRTGMKYDPTAAELFKTIHTTIDPSTAEIGTRYASIHELIAGQGTLHFHPETQGDQNASERILILYPYGEGAEFEWAGLKEPKPFYDEEEKLNCVKGNIQDPHYSLKLKPGEVTLVNLFSGAHAFRGDTLALSIHPLDIVEEDDVDTGIKRTGNPMMDNTWKYVGKNPNEAELIVPERFDAVRPEETLNIGKLMESHLQTAKQLLAQGLGKAPVQEYVDAFRQPFTREFA